MTPLTAFAIAGCLAIGAGSDRITVRDLATVFPGVDASLLDTPVAYAPAPGVRRVFRTPELRSLALRLNVAAPAETEVCVERPVAPLDPDRMLAVMRRQFPGAAIEILDYSRLPAPEGELEFPAGGLRPSLGGGFWSGAIRYAGNRRFTVWAKVKVSVHVSHVVATEDLKAATPVDASKLQLELHDEFPAPGVYVGSVQEAAGRVLRRTVTAGTPLRSAWLDEWKDVARGETVRVEVWSGGAHLELEAIAEASGAAGTTITVRNPESKKRFQARVESKGRVSVGKQNP